MICFVLAMKSKKEKTLLEQLVILAKSGKGNDIDQIMKCLSKEITIAESKFIDFSLSFVSNEIGIRRLEFYLFNGSLIQRNYCALYFNRSERYEIVCEAYNQGLIDYKQAFSR